MGGAICLVIVAATSPVRAQEIPIALDRSKPVVCRTDSEGNRWRLQCDDVAKVCYVAPDQEKSVIAGNSFELERASYCFRDSERHDADKLRAEGYRVVPAVASAPHGWMRDEMGRVFQVAFDLRKRLYVGGGIVPSDEPNGKSFGRGYVDFGLFIFETGTKRTRHRLKLVEGQVKLAPFAADLVLLHYDMSHKHRRPFLRVTSFFGKARRHDLRLNMGLWLQAGHLEIRRTNGSDEALWRVATLHGTVDLWQSKDLYSYVRLRGGLGLESLNSELREDRGALTPAAALEADFTFDQKGFHNLAARAVFEIPQYFDNDPPVGSSAHRARVGIDYEVIILAFNDQPLTIRLGIDAERRNDIPSIPDKWALRAMAGLRFSLWAPARAR